MTNSPRSKWPITTLLSATLFACLAPSTLRAETPRLQVDVDWPAFLGKHDLKSEKLAKKWSEAPHFGNASMGSMVYQKNNSLKLQLFHSDVNDHRDNTWGWTAYSRPRFEIGALHLDPVGKITNGSWHLDLWNAELNGSVKTDEGTIRYRHFVHAQDMVMVTEIWTTGAEKGCKWSWHPGKAAPTRKGVPRNAKQVEEYAKTYGEHFSKTLKIYQNNPAGKALRVGNVDVWQQDLLSGGEYASAWTETGNGGHRTLFTSIIHSYPASTAARDAAKAVQKAAETSPADLTKTHRAWWHNYYPRSFVSVPELAIESLYWQTIYRYACTARQGRAFVNTSGIWFQGGSWPYETTDWNIQAAHWGLPDANRLEQSGEVLEALHRGRKALAENVLPEEWQEDSAFLSVAVAPDMIAPRNQDMRYWDLVGNLPWALHNAWWQYRYSMDDAMLREKLYPLLRRSINLYLHMLEERDGHLHLPKTYSPESGTFDDCNFDLALLKWGCQTLLWSSKRLGLNDPLVPKWKDVLARTIDFPADDRGFMAGSKHTAPRGHRHGSHLLMIYPLHLVTIDQAGTKDVLNKSVEDFSSIKGLPAMVMAHAVPAAATIGRSDIALKGLRIQAADLLPNGLWYSPPCIEASLSVANGLQSMLLQSWGETIRVFPAISHEWQDAAFHDLRAEGAFLVSAERKSGKTTLLRIRSLAGEPCRIKTDMLNPTRIAGSDSPVRAVGRDTYQIDLPKGGDIMLAPAGSKPNLTISPVSP